MASLTKQAASEVMTIMCAYSSFTLWMKTTYTFVFSFLLQGAVESFSKKKKDVIYMALKALGTYYSSFGNVLFTFHEFSSLSCSKSLPFLSPGPGPLTFSLSVESAIIR